MDNIEKDMAGIKSSFVKIGRRTYFFDVKTTSENDYYLTITESRRDYDKGYIKNRIYIYREDFKKFADLFEEMMNFLKSEKPEYFISDELTEFDSPIEIDDAEK